jgi:hypothetical protein
MIAPNVACSNFKHQKTVLRRKPIGIEGFQFPLQQFAKVSSVPEVSFKSKTSKYNGYAIKYMQFYSLIVFDSVPQLMAVPTNLQLIKLIAMDAPSPRKCCAV